MEAAKPVRNPVAGVDMAGDFGFLRSRCSCPGCPTYNECMREKEELAFCVAGKSMTCTFDTTICLCIGCPVAAKSPGNRADYSFCCIRGTA